MDWDVLLNGTSIKAHVQSFTVEGSMDAFAYQFTLNMASFDPFVGWEWHVLPSEPVLEIRIKPDVSWISLGTYYVEKPFFEVQPDSSVMQGIWGRSGQARMMTPFASKINMTWNFDTMFNSIVADILAEAGLPWDNSQNLNGDFLVYANTFIVNDEYPVDALSRLAELSGCSLVGKMDGKVYFIPTSYAPVVGESVATYTGADIKENNLEVDLPEFANRVKILSSDTSSNYSVSLIDKNLCLPNDPTYEKIIRVVILDNDGKPVNSATVEFTVDDPGLVTLGNSSDVTGPLLGYSEILRVENYNTFILSNPPSSVVGIYPSATPSVNRAGWVVDIDGNIVTLGNNLDFCDSECRVVYNINGVASASLRGVAGETGTTKFNMSIGGAVTSEEVYVNNGCQCPLSISLEANPTSLEAGESGALLAVVEREGIDTDGEVINFEITEGSGFGSIHLSSVVLGSVGISKEVQTVIQTVSGRKDIQTKHKIDYTKPISVYAFTRDENNNIITSGSNLFGSIINDKTISLSNSSLDNGRELAVNYTCIGGALNVVRAALSPSAASGKLKIRAYMIDESEIPVEAFVSLSISDPNYDDSESLEFDFDSGGTETSEILSQYSTAWCARKLTKSWGETVTWKGILELLDAVIIVVDDGYNPRAILRSDARMGVVGDTSLPGLPGHAKQCGSESSYNVFPIAFQLWETGSAYLPVGAFLYNDEDS
jgi:hypothetical protein